MSEELEAHYGQLLGLESPWEVTSVDLKMEEQRVDIALTHKRGSRVNCPECGDKCAVHDHSPERTWRHLDTMQFETRLKAKVPRSDCPECGVKTVEGVNESVGQRYGPPIKTITCTFPKMSIVGRCERSTCP